MDDYSDIIPDENVQIASPKKCVFLLNKINMFINSEKKKYNYQEYIKNNNLDKQNNNNSSDSDNLKTIIKEPAILTSNVLIDLKSLIKSKNRNKKRVTSKMKKNAKISLYKKAGNDDNIYYSNNNSINNSNDHINLNTKEKISNKKLPNKKKGNLKNNMNNKNKNKNKNNIAQSQKIISKEKKECIINKIKPNTNTNANKNKNINLKENLANNNTNNNANNKIFIKKKSQEYKKMRNSLSINKKDKKVKQGIITKKIHIKPLLTDSKSIEPKKRIFITQKELISNISIKNNLNNNINENNIERDKTLNNIVNTKSICLSKSNKNLLEDKNIYKSKIFHIDYFHNIKKDLTTTNIGLNIIKEICYKKLKNNFSKLKKIFIYKRKIINNMTPKQKKYININKNNTNEIINNEDKKNNSQIKQRALKAHTYSNNKKYCKTICKYDSFYRKKFNIELNKTDEKNKKTNIINKNKKNSVLLFNPNSYINNCNINSIQINLFNNETMNNRSEILTSKNNTNSSVDNNNYSIKTCKTSINETV